MPQVDEQGRPLPPERSGELETILGFLEFHRATFAWKCRDIDAEGMARTIASSSMSLGGMVKHLALVEDHWFSQVLLGKAPNPPWDEVDWDADPDWDWHSAAEDSPAALQTLWQRAVDQSRRAVAEALSMGGLDQLARDQRHDDQPNLRWIILHMIEEYARHNGHADLLREAIDGAAGE